MRVLVMVKATKNSEAGILPGDPRAPAGFDKLLEDMGKFNEELVKAGVMLAADGLHASSKGKRVRFTGSGGKRTVVDGPFAETKELVAGFWIWHPAATLVNRPRESFRPGMETPVTRGTRSFHLPAKRLPRS